MLRMLEEEIPVRRLYSARNYARRWRREHGSPIPMIVAQEDRDCGLDACHNPGVTPVHVRLSADMDVVGTFCEEHAPSAEAQYLASRYKRMDLDAGYTIVAPQDPERWEVDALMDPARKAMCAWCYVYPCGDGAALVIEDKTGQQWGLCTACYGEYARRASSRAPR